MGSTDGMTREAYHAFEEAEVIFGAERMLENLPGKGIKVPYYRADDIISYLIEHPQYTKVAAAFSGDSGFLQWRTVDEKRHLKKQMKKVS